MADQEKEQVQTKVKPYEPTPKPTEYLFQSFSEEIKAQVIDIVLKDIEIGGKIFRAIMTQLEQKLSNRQMTLGSKS